MASFPGWSRILGIDAVGGSPYCDLTDQCSARVTSWCSPDRLPVALAGVVLDLVGKVGDKLRSLCQVASSRGIGLERCWNAWQPGQRTRVGRGERCQAPVEHGRHIWFERRLRLRLPTGGGAGAFPFQPPV